MTKAKKSSASARGNSRGTSRGGSGKSPLCKVLVRAGIVLGALLLLTAIGAFATFSGYRDYPEPKIGHPHYLFLRDLASQLRNNRREDEATIRLSPEEVRLMLELIRHSSQFVGDRRNVPPPGNFMLGYDKDGGVDFAVPVRAAGSWCFGGRIYLSGKLFLEKKDGGIVADLPKFRFGRFDLPVPGGADTVAPDWRERMKNALPEELMEAIKSIHSERDGTVVIIYIPNELRKPLKKHLDKVHERCSEDLKPWIRQLIQAL